MEKMGSKFFKPILIKRLHKSSKTSIQSSLTSSSSSSSHNSKLLYPIIPRLYDQSYTENPNFKICKRWHVGHSHHHHDQTSKDGERIFRLGLAADIGLTAGKALTGYLSGSTAIIADAAHSLSDVVLSGVALLSFRASRVPKDKEHPYGHGKFETLGALGISSVLILTAGGIAWHAVDVLMGVLSASPELAHSHHHGIDMDHPILALNMTIVAIAIKEGLYWVTKKAGERSGSGLMKANAWHHRADAVSSVVALIGVGGSILGVTFLDPLAGLVVSGMILKAGLQTGYQSILELVDAAIPSHHLDPIRKTVLQVKGVEGCRHLRGRRAGSSIYLDVKIQVDPFCSISVAHQIGENVRHQIQKSHPEVSEVFIQLEPVKREVTEETFNSNTSEPKEVDEIVNKLLTSNFHKMVTVKRVSRRKEQDKYAYEFELIMPADAYLRDGGEMSEEFKNQVSNSMKITFHVDPELDQKYYSRINKDQRP